MNYACAILMYIGVPLQQNQPFSYFPACRLPFRPTSIRKTTFSTATASRAPMATAACPASAVPSDWANRCRIHHPFAMPILNVTLWAEHLFYDEKTQDYRWSAWKAGWGWSRSGDSSQCRRFRQQKFCGSLPTRRYESSVTWPQQLSPPLRSQRERLAWVGSCRRTAAGGLARARSSRRSGPKT